MVWNKYEYEKLNDLETPMDWMNWLKKNNQKFKLSIDDELV